MRCRPTKQIHLCLIVSISLFGIACSNVTDTNTTASASDSLTIQSFPVCYAFVSATDTVALKLLIQKDRSVSGELHYKLDGKDANHGSINGVMKGDTIFADYRFMSEGKESVRQMIFLKSDSMLTEGYGPVEKVNGEMRFANDAVPDFREGLQLFLTKCKN